MRAKIWVNAPSLTDNALRALFPDIGNTAIFDCKDSEQGKLQLRDWISVIHGADQGKAENGAIFTFYHPTLHAAGLVSREDESLVIRIKDVPPMTLRIACERVVKGVDDYCRRNTKQCSFDDPVSVMEMMSREQIIRGTVLITKRAKIKSAKDKNSTAFWVMTFGAIVWAALMIFTLYLYKQQIYSSQEAFIRWGFEFLIGLRASITVTVLVSALEFFQNYASVKNHPIEWSLAAPAS